MEQFLESQPHSPNLEQHLRSHTEETIHHSKCKNHRHAVYISTRKTSELHCKTAIKDTYKLKNQGSEATDSCTSTSWKWSWITGKHRATRDSNTRWSRRVPCMDVLSASVKQERKNLACDYRTYNIRAIGVRKLLATARMPALLTCNCDHVRKHAKTCGTNPTSE